MPRRAPPSATCSSCDLGWDLDALTGLPMATVDEALSDLPR